MAIWEKPVFSRMVSFVHPEVIKEGMVFALETFWPASDGWSAARIEEQMVVTKDGCEVIYPFPGGNLMVAGVHYHTATGPLPLRARDPIEPQQPAHNTTAYAGGQGGRQRRYEGSTN